MGLVFLEGKILPVFPCLATKRPATPHGFKDATADSAAIAELCRSHWGPLVGVPTGERSGLDVLDVDRGGEDWLVQYKATHGLPPTRIHATRSGGLHLFFRHRPGLRCNRDLLAPNVDVRSTGGYVILWHLAGCRVLSDAPIAPWPAPLLQLLAEAQETQRTPSAAERASPMNVKNGALVSIARDQELPKTLYFKMCELMPGSSGRDGRRVRELLKIVLQKHEGRNDNLNRIAFIFQKLISSGVIDYAAAEQLLLDAAWINGYVAKDGVRAALATIRSGLGHQTQEPHQIFYFLW